MRALIPELVSQEVLLVVAPHAARSAMLELVAMLARTGPVRVLDGGNQFNAYQVARSVRRYTAGLEETMARIQLSRAFTCYQMTALLASSVPEAIPTVVLDLLCTFYDENVQLAERRRLLAGCTRRMRQLCRLAPVVTAAQPAGAGQPERAMLLDILCASANQVWELEAPPAAPALPGLFQEGA
jgi:hypothetical protein